MWRPSRSSGTRSPETTSMPARSLAGSPWRNGTSPHCGGSLCRCCASSASRASVPSSGSRAAGRAEIPTGVHESPHRRRHGQRRRQDDGHARAPRGAPRARAPSPALQGGSRLHRSRAPRGGVRGGVAHAGCVDAAGRGEPAHLLARGRRARCRGRRGDDGALRRPQGRRRGGEQRRARQGPRAARRARPRRRLLLLLPRPPGPPGRGRRRARRLESARGRRPARGDAPALPRRRLSRGACAAPRRQRGGARGGARVRRRGRRDLRRVRRAHVPHRAASHARRDVAPDVRRAAARGAHGVAARRARLRRGGNRARRRPAAQRAGARVPPLDVGGGAGGRARDRLRGARRPRRAGSARGLPEGRHARQLRPSPLRELPGAAGAPARAGGALTTGRAPAKGIGMRARLAIVLAAAALGSCAPAPAPSPAGAPARIVSLAPSITEIVYALGAGERLVGVCAQCDYPAAVASVPRVGGYLAPSVEVTLARRPDLVIAAPSPGNREAVRAIERAGVRVLVVHDRTLAELWDSIRGIAGALGLPAAGERLVADVTRRLEAVRARVADLPPRRVLMIVGHRPLVAVGRGTLQDELLTMAGGVNVAADAGQVWPTLTLELVVARAPEVIVDASMGSEAGARELFAGLTTVPAVQNGRMITLTDETLLRAGPRAPEAAAALARAIHPEAFAG